MLRVYRKLIAHVQFSIDATLWASMRALWRFDKTIKSCGRVGWLTRIPLIHHLQHERVTCWKGKFAENAKKYKKKEKTIATKEKICSHNGYYSPPRLVVDCIEELIVELLLVKNVWCQRETRPLHLLRHGMVGFGVGLNLGTVYVVTEKICPKNA